MSSQILTKNDLFSHQQSAIKKLGEKNKSILRLDTGLGKTAICINYCIEKKYKCLVIVPAFLKDNWIKEINMWGGFDLFTVVSYNKASTDYSNLSGFDMIVCDEAHYLKNWGAKRTKNIVLNLLTKADNVIFSTATPYVRSALDYHPLFSICEPGKWGKASQFAETYCKKKFNPFKKWQKWEYYSVKEEKAEELNKRSNSFMISMSKKDAGIELPTKLCSNITISVGSKHHLKNLDLEEYYDIESNKMQGGLFRILSTEGLKLGLSKIDSVVEFVNNINVEQNIVIFCKHKEVANRLSLSLEGSLITGDTSFKERTEIVEKFQQNSIRVLVCTMASTGVGLTLTASNIAIFAELPWSYAELKQCEDRLHRISQKNNVNIYRFIAKKTIDDFIFKVIEDKRIAEDLTIGSF